jgi:putative SOS response-associated peptidase YedK
MGVAKGELSDDDVSHGPQALVHCRPILTKPPASCQHHDIAAQFHNRMPLILERNTWEAWLQGDPDTAATLLKPANEDVLVAGWCRRAVGNVKNNFPELLEA